MSRTTLFALALLAGGVNVFIGPAQATEYPWCVRYGDDHGGTNCGFSTLAQCEAALSGNAGICDRNLFFSPSPPGSAAGPKDAPRKQPGKRG